MAILIKKAFYAAIVFVAFLKIGAAQASVFYPQYFKLSNGLQLVVVKNKLSPAVGHMVWYKVGALDEVEGKTGIAHYLEHMMFKGTEKMPAGFFHQVIASKGGEENAFTMHDATAYHEVVAAEHLGLVMQMEADRMRGLKIDPDQAAREKKVVLSERQQRTENSPHGLFAEKFRAKLFGDHPYGRPVIGSRQDIEGLSSQDLRAFYKHAYAPNRAIVVVSGNVNTQDVLRLASATYGTLPMKSGLEDKRFATPCVPKEMFFVHEDARITQPYATRKIIVPSVKEHLARSLALDVLAEILGAETGPLYEVFVRQKKNASAISVSYDGLTRGPSLFSFSVSPASGKDAQALEKEVWHFVKKKAQAGFSQKEIEDAKQRLFDSAVFARDKLMAPAQILGHALAVGASLDVIENWPDNVRRVTRAQVERELRALVKNPYTLVGVLKGKEGKL